MKIANELKIQPKNISDVYNYQMGKVWINTTINSGGYMHMKTNIPNKSSIMFHIQAEGYNYGKQRPIDSVWTGYTYSGWDDVLNAHARDYADGIDIQRIWNSPVKFGTYISSDNYVTLVAYSTTWYYAGFLLHAMFPCPSGRGHDFQVTAHTLQQTETHY